MQKNTPVVLVMAIAAFDPGSSVASPVKFTQMYRLKERLLINNVMYLYFCNVFMSSHSFSLYICVN